MRRTPGNAHQQPGQQVARDAGQRAGDRELQQLGRLHLPPGQRDGHQHGGMDDVHRIGAPPEQLPGSAQRARRAREAVQQREDDAPGDQRLPERIEDVERLAGERRLDLRDEVDGRQHRKGENRDASPQPRLRRRHALEPARCGGRESEREQHHVACKVAQLQAPHVDADRPEPTQHEGRQAGARRGERKRRVRGPGAPRLHVPERLGSLARCVTGA